MKGKLIVFDGADGSGKTVQTQLYLDYLKKKNIPHLLVDFPQYEGFYGKVAAMYLRGEFGPIHQVSPFLISMIFALDRSTIKEKIVNTLESGGIVVANRYTTSNIAHQTANIHDESKRTELINWIEELEYKELKLPKEDTVIYLYVPWKVGMKLSEEKLVNGNHHDYLKGQFDIHEKDERHRVETEEIYLSLAKNRSNWIKIYCVNSDGNLRSKESIHEEIVTKLNI